MLAQSTGLISHCVHIIEHQQLDLTHLKGLALDAHCKTMSLHHTLLETALRVTLNDTRRSVSGTILLQPKLLYISIYTPLTPTIHVTFLLGHHAYLFMREVRIYLVMRQSLLLRERGLARRLRGRRRTPTAPRP